MDAFEADDVSAAAASVSVSRAGDQQENQKHLADIAQLLHPSESRLHIGINVLKTRIFLIRGLKISLLWRFRNTSSHEMCRWSVFST